MAAVPEQGRPGWPHDFREAVAELQPLPAEQRISGLADLLLARLEPRREPPRQVREAVRLIRARRGRVTVRSLASQVNLSISQLERGFTRHVGVGPKLLARQTRVCALAAEATTLANPGWALLAARYGYADQAHLAREFRELTGLTPSSLARAGSDADFLQDALACRLGVFKPPAAKEPEAVKCPNQPILMPGIRLAAIAPVSTAS
jgi:AraC-like DNA-binding protein